MMPISTNNQENHIHSVIVSYKRKELTKETLEHYLDTVSMPYSLVIVDNGSPPDTVEWLSSLDVPVLFLNHNYYPGYATNRGWEKMPPQTTLLHRLDNDIFLLPGWCENVIECFENPIVGQYGFHGEGDMEWLISQNLYPSGKRGWTVGGNCVISREIYNKGLRYSERPWTAGGILEDTQLTLDVWKMGYERVFATQPVLSWASGLYPDPVYDEEIRKSRGL
jgi:glycosyltransferase involved in cell wall biosynthesis